MPSCAIPGSSQIPAPSFLRYLLVIGISYGVIILRDYDRNDRSVCSGSQGCSRARDQSNTVDDALEVLVLWMHSRCTITSLNNNIDIVALSAQQD